MNSTATIFARLNGDLTLLALLASYAPPIGLTRSAIFNEFAPVDFDMGPQQPMPCLIVAAPEADDAVETFTERARSISQEVRGYGFNAGSSASLDTVMQRVRTLFHNAPSSLTVTGGRADLSRVSGPVGSPVDDPSLIGRRLTIRLEIQET